MKYSTLYCTYDLENQQLYSVKWYRGSHEFYRFTPGVKPSTKIFPLASIAVDENNSNCTQVVLRDIEYNLSGNFSCEVTTDTTPVSTGTDTKPMRVVQLPDHPPTISVGFERLDYGDILRANCTSSPSKPQAFLKFLLNNMTVAKTEKLPRRESDKPEWSDLMLDMELTQYHFNQGRLYLQCVAQIMDIYHEEVGLQLGSARDPVPERVSSPDTASQRNLHQLFYLLPLCIMLKWN